MAERTSAADHQERLPLSASAAAPASTSASIASSPAPVVAAPSNTHRSSARLAATTAVTLPESNLAGPAPASNLSDAPHRRLSSCRKRQAPSNAGSAYSEVQTDSLSRRSKRQKILPEAAALVQPATDTPTSSQRSRKKGKAPAVMDAPQYAINSDQAYRPEPPDANLADTFVSGSAGPSNPLAGNAQPASSSRGPHHGNKTMPRSKESLNSNSSRKLQRRIMNPDEEDISMGGTDEGKDSVPSKQTSTLTRGPADDNNGRNREDEDEDEDEGQEVGGEEDGEKEESDEDEEEDQEQDDEEEDEDDEDEDDDPFSGFGVPGGSTSGLSSTLRALTGMMTGISGRLRSLLSNLKQDDPSVQLIALQELSELLLVSNEDNLSGHFSPDAFVKELVALMSKDDQPEVMLLACRCLANLMEALPATVANVVYGNAVPVLCQKLLEIAFIDLAEQSLSTLEKVSYEYPASIVREGGLTACLSYLDFFATSTQRTAVTIAANCCRNISGDSFPVVRDVMPTLLNVLGSSDQRVVEKASLCVTGIVESFKHHPSKLEELVSVDLLRSVLRLLLPGTTNMISSSIHTQLLRVLAFTARASPGLAAALFKLNVVETVYQILTGVSPPSGTDDVASKLDSVVVMQALIHRPREQIVEALNVICELLPNLPRNADPSYGDFLELPASTETITQFSLGGRSRRSSSDKRLILLDDCKTEVRRFALIIFPTLTDAFSSTINLSVRQKVLTAHLKMLSNLDEKILMEALVPVPYASFLASILSQRDHPSLVMLALQATELLLSRLDNIYRYQFYREGVIHEVSKLATEDETDSLQANEAHLKEEQTSHPVSLDQNVRLSEHEGEGDHDEDDELEQSKDANDNDEEDEDDEIDVDENDEHDENDENEYEPHPDDMSPASSRGSTMSLDIPARRFVSDIQSLKSRIRNVAQKFIETHESERHDHVMKNKATGILHDLSDLACELEAFYLKRTSTNLAAENGKILFSKLASYFDTEILESVTSAELLSSGLVRVLLSLLSNPDEELARAAQSSFLEVFMERAVKSKPKTATAESPATPFSVLIHKLQDLLSRSEHFEVITVHHNTFDGNKSSPASMLGKQIRLRLVADDASNIPRPYRNIMVSIHAIATFKSLDDYLRPRICVSERPRGARRDGLTRALAAMAGAHGPGFPLSSAAAARFAERSSFSLETGPPPPPPPPGASTPASSRQMRKTRNRSLADTGRPAVSSQAGESSRDRAILRRSRQHAASENSLPPPYPPYPPLEDEDEAKSTLECADEKQLPDDDEIGDASALDAIVGELDEDMEDQSNPDPSAINMEVATGGGVTARKDDGTKVPTPSLPHRSGDLPKPSPSTPSPSSSLSRPMSYASAVQAVPQDWHIEFSLDDRVVSLETTIYRAVHALSPGNAEDHSSRNIWSATHTIKFRRVQGPPPAEPANFLSNTDAKIDTSEIEIPVSLAKHPSTTSILRLLKILHDLNDNIEDVLAENRNTIIGLNVEPLSQFVNTKLTAKLNRQLEEPLVVASNCLPAWSEDLARFYPFLFPFETRHLFLQSTSFGYARSMARWQSSQSTDDSPRDRNGDRPFLGRLQRQKVRISRTKILESALKVMELYGASQSILEVEYFEEVGTGLGPTLEFYSTVSKEFSKNKLKLWREVESTGVDSFAAGHNGLFPRPLSPEEASTPNGERIVHLFKMLGKFVARSMIDSRIIDIHFNPIFFRIGDTSYGGVKPSLGAVKVVDPGLARSLKTIKKFALAKREIDENPSLSPAKKVAAAGNITIDHMRLEDLCLDFTLPGYPGIELDEDGGQQRVSIDNVDHYLERVIDMTLGSGVRRQVDAFRAGFSQVFPYSALSAFTPDELVSLFGRMEEDWSLETLLDSIKADHGYNMDSPSVRSLLQTMSEFNPSQRRDFLQFTTGSPKLPIGGFKSLTPMFTVVCKPSEHPYTSDDYLPSVMTCVNYLKLPNYSTVEMMKKQLFIAMKEGQGAFHLS